MSAFTLAQKIMAAHAVTPVGDEDAAPGRILNCRLDLVLANDITAPPAVKAFESMGAVRVFDKRRV
ncbi:MAG: 3-isopropylmalate dehydratase large subunit, partial [Desulfovibrio sp.]|nr:3-isopropylmalate dehydratase large subunit [Desulfovibrio sp.]